MSTERRLSVTTFGVKRLRQNMTFRANVITHTRRLSVRSSDLSVTATLKATR